MMANPATLYQYTTDGTTYNGTWLTLAQLQATANIGIQLQKIKIKVTGDPFDTFESFSITTYITGDFDPIPPTLTSVTAGNGEFTANFTAAVPTDTIRIAYYAPSVSSDIVYDTQEVVGSGSITVTGLQNNVRYTVAAIAVVDPLVSLPSNVIGVTPVANTDAILKRLRDGVASILDGTMFQVDTEITSGFLAYHDLEDESGTVNILVSPDQVDIDSIGAGYTDDIRDMGVKIAIIRRATTDAQADECLRVAEDIYNALHNQVIDGSRNVTKDYALTYDEEYLRQNQVFRAVMRFYFRRTG